MASCLIASSGGEREYRRILIRAGRNEPDAEPDVVLRIWILVHSVGQEVRRVHHVEFDMARGR